MGVLEIPPFKKKIYWLPCYWLLLCFSLRKSQAGPNICLCSCWATWAHRWSSLTSFPCFPEPGYREKERYLFLRKGHLLTKGSSITWALLDLKMSLWAEHRHTHPLLCRQWRSYSVFPPSAKPKVMCPFCGLRSVLYIPQKQMQFLSSFPMKDVGKLRLWLTC